MVAPKNTNKTPIDGKENSKHLSEKRKSQALNRLQATSANLDLFFNSIKTKSSFLQIGKKLALCSVFTVRFIKA